MNFFKCIVYTFKKEINLKDVQRSTLFILFGYLTLLIGTASPRHKTSPWRFVNFYSPKNVALSI